MTTMKYVDAFELLQEICLQYHTWIKLIYCKIPVNEKELIHILILYLYPSLNIKYTIVENFYNF